MAGKHTWQVINQGQEIHFMLLTKLLPGKTWKDVQHALKTQDHSNVTDDQHARFVEAISGGQTQYVSMTLTAGHYAALCFVPTKDGVPHAMLGMMQELVVKEQTFAALSVGRVPGDGCAWAWNARSGSLDAVDGAGEAPRFRAVNLPGQGRSLPAIVSLTSATFRTLGRMNHLWILAALAALGQAQASTGVSCLLKTKVVGVYNQPFSQQIGLLRVQAVKDDRQQRNDFPCTQHFRVGMTLLAELGFYDLKISMRYGIGQTVYLNFAYTDDRSGLITRRYQVISAQEYAARQK